MKNQAGCFKPALAVAVIVLAAVGAKYHAANVIPVRNFPAPIPTPSPNGFDLYVQAALAIVNTGQPVDAVYDTNLLPPGEAAARYSLARRQAWLKQNARAFATFKAGLAMESRSPSTRGFNGLRIPDDKLRSMARYKVVEANTLALEGQWRQAADARLDIVQLGDDSQRGGNLISALVGFSIQAMGLNTFEDVVPHLGAKDCRELAARCAKLSSKRPTFASTLAEQKIVSDGQLVAAWLERDSARFSLVDRTRGSTYRSLFVSRRDMLDTMNKTFDIGIAVADKPLLLAKPVFPPAYSDFMMSGTLLQREFFNSARSKATWELAQLRLALRAYRLEKGAYPANLQQLVPALLPTVPIDPFGSGGPWQYKTRGDSFTVWSIGPDGKDDGGKSIPSRNGGKYAKLTDKSSGDYAATP